MKKIIISLIYISLLPGFVYSQYDNADAVFEKIVKEYTLNDDGSMDFHYHKQLKLQSYLSFNRLYGETFIIFDPEYQKLAINNAYTIMADGTKITTPKNAFNEVLPRAAAHSASFNHLREMVVTHTALEIGATIFLDYNLSTEKGFLPALMGNEVIEEPSPVEEMKIVVRVPVTVELYHKMFNLRTAPEIIVQGSQKIYTWVFKGIEASAKESHRDDYLQEIPRLTFSTDDTEKVVDWLLNQTAFDYEIDDNMQAFVTAVVDKEQGEIKTMLEIQKEVVNYISLDRINPVYNGFRVRAPVQVWQSNDGNQLEKAILLCALLQHAKFNAIPVLVGPKYFFDEKVGNLLIFGEILVMVSTKNQGDVIISPTKESDINLKHLLGNDILIPLRKNRGIDMLKPSSGKNSIEMIAAFASEDISTINGKIDLELLNATNPYFAFIEDSGYVKKMFRQGVSANDTEKSSIPSSNEAKTTLEISVSGTDPFTESHGYYYWNMPVLKNGFESWHISYPEPERTSVFEIPFPIEEIYEFSFEIPEPYEFVNLKINDQIKNKAGSVVIQIMPKDYIVKVKRELKISKNYIDPEMFDDFRELVNAWLDKNNRILVFKKAQ
nr:DUF3857 domain-containing protein [Bacteroidota bacterium]